MTKTCVNCGETVKDSDIYCPFCGNPTEGEKKTGTEYQDSTDGLACPNCGATGFAIKEVEDKSKIISYIPKPIYAKKLLCSKCGFEF